MALSRIWSAFIIIAIVAASISCIFSEGGNTIFNKMVVGKTGDTTQTKRYDSSNVPASVVATLGGKTEYKKDEDRIVKTADNKYLTYKEQTADGVIETCKAAVNLCLGLIGVMTLFMGFMSIAEKAGGINLLSRIIGPFFSKNISGVAQGPPCYGTYDDEFFC